MLRSTASEGAWTLLERVDFELRSAAYVGLRLARWSLEPSMFPRPRPSRGPRLQHQLCAARIPRRASSFGPKLEAGRWQNLRLVVAAIDGTEATPTRPFSFWRTVGRLTAARGFVQGAHFEGGCIVPALGGGICSMSDRLYELALRSDCEILERHAHTLWVDRRSGSTPSVDATVKWPYVDLRFAPRHGAIRIGATVEADHIALSIRGSEPIQREISLHTEDHPRTRRGAVRFTRSTLTRIRRSPGLEQIEWLARDEKRVVDDPHRTCETCNAAECSRPRRARARR